MCFPRYNLLPEAHKLIIAEIRPDIGEFQMRLSEAMTPVVYDP